MRSLRFRLSLACFSAALLGLIVLTQNSRAAKPAPPPPPPPPGTILFKQIFNAGTDAYSTQDWEMNGSGGAACSSGNWREITADGSKCLIQD